MPPIKENGSNQIVYTPPDKLFDETGVAYDDQFGIADRINQVKQIQFDINCLTPGPGVATIQVDIAGDQTINLSGLGAKSNSFAIIQPDHGTSPTATSYTDTLTETSSDNSVVITGNSSTNTLNFQASATIQSGSTAANNATSVNIANTIVKRDGSGNFNAGTITASLIGNVTGNVTGSSGTFTGSLAGDVTGTQSSTVVTLVGGSTAANVHSAELAANAATSSNTPNTIVKRDSSGNFSAGTITANLTGNASGSSGTFTGSLSGDVTGAQSATVVSFVGTSSATNVHNAELLANAATSANTASALVRRDASGNFNAGAIHAVTSLETPSLIMDGTVSGAITIGAGSTPSSYSLTLPAAQGAATSTIQNNGSGVLSWVTLTSNIDGGSATTNYVAAQLINGGSA